jgi:hypothetical protein
MRVFRFIYANMGIERFEMSGGRFNPFDALFEMNAAYPANCARCTTHVNPLYCGPISLAGVWREQTPIS